MQRLNIAGALKEQRFPRHRVASLHVTLPFVRHHLPNADAQRGESPLLAKNLRETPRRIGDDQFMSEVFEVIGGDREVVACEIGIVDPLSKPTFSAQSIA